MTICKEDIVSIEITKSDLSLIRKMATAACIGGYSNIRHSDRMATLEEDQLVGQIGTYAGIKYLMGSVHQYMISRWYANQHPTNGDGGSDIPASNIDFKASLKRYPKKEMLSYRLPVRPRERHNGWVYILILVDPIVNERTTAHLIGWASDDMLPYAPEAEGPFEGAHVLVAKELKPLMPIKWAWLPQ